MEYYVPCKTANDSHSDEIGHTLASVSTFLKVNLKKKKRKRPAQIRANHLAHFHLFVQGGEVKGQEVIIAVGRGDSGHGSLPLDAFQWEFDCLTSN